MKRTNKFTKASLLGIAAVSTVFTACDLNDIISAQDPVPGSSAVQTSSSSQVIPNSSSSAIPTPPVNTYTFETWRGTDGNQKINTGFGNDTETEGYWFSYNDEADGGASRVVWPVQPGDEYSDESLQPIVEHCKGICGTAALEKGYLTYNPFVGVGFHLGGETSYTDPTPRAVDASSMGGVCVSYASEAAMDVEMDLGDNVNAQIGYANPYVALAKSRTGLTKFIPWSDFKQPSWYKGNYKINGIEAAKQLVSLRFKIQSYPGNFRFNITEVGSFGACTGVPAALDFTSQDIPDPQPPQPPQPPKPPQPPVVGNGNFETWLGDSPRVITGYDSGTETSGYWFSYGDDADGGASTVVWPVPLGNEYSVDAIDPVIDYCNGLCGTAVLSKGTLTYNPFVGVGFNLGGEASNTDFNPIAVDASDMGGICITYTSDIAPVIELGLGDNVDAAIGYAQPYVSLAKSRSLATTKAIPWSSFKQPSWYKGSTKISGEEAAKQLVSIKFKMQGVPGSYNFNIRAIGPYINGTCASVYDAGNP